jgi:hypothetical protein
VIAVAIDTLALVINAERNGAGVPLAYAPPNGTKDQIKELSALAQSYRAAESAGGSLPNGAEPGSIESSARCPMFSPASATGDRPARYAPHEMSQCCAGTDCDALGVSLRVPTHKNSSCKECTDFRAGHVGKLAECRRRRGHAVQFALLKTLPRATWTLCRRSPL